MQVGDLVRSLSGNIGLVVGYFQGIGAKTGDVWVSWTGDLQPRREHGPSIEVISENR